MDIGMIMSIVGFAICSLYIFFFFISIIVNNQRFMDKLDEYILETNTHNPQYDNDKEGERLFNSAMFLDSDD